MKQIEIYTDGACSGNPGPGGWGAILMCEGRIKEISGFEENTTNNRMEILAVIEGVRALKSPCELKIYSDSAYTVDAFNKKWLDSWRKNGWKNSNKDEVKNKDLWLELLAVLSPHKYEFIKVKGHSDNPYNNRCDKMATGEIKQKKAAYGDL